jgi:hypothetical protein
LPEEEAELLDIIRRKVLGIPVSQESSTGIPISQLSGLSLKGLLSPMRILAKFHLLLPRLQKSIPKRLVTRHEFGKRFAIGKRTLRRMLAMKKIRTITLHPGNKQRTFIDLQQLHEPPSAPGKIFTLPTTAAAIGIGARALSKLRASGHFEVKYLLTRDGYHERISSNSLND